MMREPRLSEPIWKQNLKSGEYERKTVCSGAPLQNISAIKNGGGKHQSTQGLYKEPTVVAKRQMQNNFHEKPDHDPSSSSSSSSQTVSPSPPNYYWTLKPTSVTLKLKGRELEKRWAFF